MKSLFCFLFLFAFAISANAQPFPSNAYWNSTTFFTAGSASTTGPVTEPAIETATGESQLYLLGRYQIANYCCFGNVIDGFDEWELVEGKLQLSDCFTLLESYQGHVTKADYLIGSYDVAFIDIGPLFNLVDYVTTTGRPYLGGPNAPLQSLIRDKTVDMGSATSGHLVHNQHLLEISVWAKRLPGDTNEDGDVDFGDFTVLSANFGQTFTGYTWVKGDFNGNGTVDFADFLILAMFYGGQPSEIAAGP